LLVAFGARVEWIHGEGVVGYRNHVVLVEGAVVLAQGRDVCETAGCPRVASWYLAVNYRLRRIGLVALVTHW
jgi:hypothetical protein